MLKTLVKPNNSAMPISSRRYLFTYEHVVKYFWFAERREDFHEFSGINPKYLTTTESIGISLMRYRLSETVIAS
ncbi:MAG TPA: hypothetical protein VMW42_09085 [Desulfatiglandales bacterium]|nr:hypothetical protein [Desulfatiglandales bacterium]